MTSTLKPYSSYKPSGVPWLGDLPEHWDQRSLWTTTRLRTELNPGGLGLLSVFLGRGVIPYDEGGGQVHAPSLDLGNYQVVRPGDFVLNNQQAWRGSVGVSRYLGIVSPAYIVLQILANLSPSYADFLMQSPPMVGQFVVASKGVGDIQRQIYWPYLRYTQLPAPPPGEQAAIVRYLDHVNRRVRKYIRAKQKLIGLLNEQKQAIIHKAVTRGLDPNVKLKPSGVPWLGDVPEHWSVTKLARMVRSSNAGEVIDKGWWGRGAEVLYTCARNPLQSDYQGFPTRKRTTGNDLLVTRNGTPYVHRPPAGAIYSNVVQRVNLKDGSNREYVALALEQSTRGMKGYGVSIESLNYDMWKVLEVLSPPDREQSAIVASVDEATVGILRAIDCESREIDLLREYRTRLVADVVTGKLDVREAAAGLPEEAGETESPDVIEADVDDPEDSVGEADADDGEAGS